MRLNRTPTSSYCRYHCCCRRTCGRPLFMQSTWVVRGWRPKGGAVGRLNVFRCEATWKSLVIRPAAVPKDGTHSRRQYVEQGGRLGGGGWWGDRAEGKELIGSPSWIRGPAVEFRRIVTDRRTGWQSKSCVCLRSRTKRTGLKRVDSWEPCVDQRTTDRPTERTTTHAAAARRSWARRPSPKRFSEHVVGDVLRAGAGRDRCCHLDAGAVAACADAASTCGMLILCLWSQCCRAYRRSAAQQWRANNQAIGAAGIPVAATGDAIPELFSRPMHCHRKHVTHLRIPRFTKRRNATNISTAACRQLPRATRRQVMCVTLT